MTTDVCFSLGIGMKLSVVVSADLIVVAGSDTEVVTFISGVEFSTVVDVEVSIVDEIISVLASGNGKFSIVEVTTDVRFETIVLGVLLSVVVGAERSVVDRNGTVVGASVLEETYNGTLLTEDVVVETVVFGV